MLASAALVGCGDDSGSTVDGSTGCTGHLCDAAAGKPALTDHEGGQIMLEYINFDTELQAAFGLPTGVHTALRSMAYFMSAQTPESNPLLTPGACVNLETTHGWPLWVGTPHTDMDVGALTVTGKKADGTAVTIDLPKMPAGIDNIGRPHDIYYQTIQPDAAAFMKPDSAFSMHFGGSATVAATDFTDSIFLAHDYSVNTPGEEDNGPLVAGTNFPVSWTPATSANIAAGDEVIEGIWLVDSNGSPTHGCAVPHSAGTFTIPGATIAEFKQVAAARGASTSKVILLRNAIVHKLEWLPTGDTNNKRRIDMLGIMCWAQLMDVQ